MTDPGHPPPVPPGTLASSPLEPGPAEELTSGGDDRLATAFTRIVGEQLNEQREISALLSDLRARLNSLDGLTQEMDESVARRVATVTSEVREVLESQGDPDAARREAEAAREQIVAARSQVYELSSTLGASIEGIEAELAGLTPAVSGLGPLLSALGPRLEELFEGLETLQAGVTELKTGVSGIQSGVEGVQSGVDGVHSGVAGVQTDVSVLPSAGSLTELSDGLAGMRTDLRSLPEQVGGAVGGRVAESLDLIRDSVHAVVSELAALHAEVSETPEPDPLMTELEAQLAGVASRVSALGELPEQVEGLSTDLGAVWQAVQVLDDKLGALPTDENLVPSVAAVGAAVVILENAVLALDARFEGFIASDVGPDPELAEVSDSVVAVGITLAEMRTTLTEVSGRLDELARRPVDDSALRQLAVDVADLNNSLVALDTNVAAIGIVVAAVDTAIATIDGKLAPADEEINVGPALDGLSAALAGVAGGVDDLDAKLDERLDALTLALPVPPPPDARLDTVGESLHEVQTSVAGLGAELAAAVASLAARIDEVHAQTVPMPVPETEDLALAPLAVAAISESLAGIGVDLVAVGARLADLEARAEHSPAPLSASDLTVVTAPLTGEVASLRGDLDNVRRLLLEDLPDDPIDAAQLAADLDATLTAAVGAQVSEAVSQHVAEVLETALTEAVQRAVAEAVGSAVSSAVGTAVHQSVGIAVNEAVAQSVDDAVARSLQTSVEDAVRITVSPTLAQAMDAAVDRAAGQQVELEARLRSHVDEAVMALAEIVLNTPNLAIPHSRPGIAGKSVEQGTAEPSDGDADSGGKKRRFGRR